MKPGLTVIIHTKNEEQNIAACIASCNKIASEVLVVDMHSTDATIYIAKKMGARVVLVPDAGFVEPSRQKAIEKAKNEWILIIDADERLHARLRKEILALLLLPDYDCIRFPRKNIMFGKWIQHGMRWPDYQLRLFRKNALSWPITIHSQPIYDRTRCLDLPAQLNNAIIHSHSATVMELLEKTYQQANNEDYYTKQGELTASLIKNRIENEFGWRFSEHEGYKDGIPGFMSAKFMEFYRFLEFAFYWERRGYSEIFSADELNKTWNPERQRLQLEQFSKLSHSKLYLLWLTYQKLKDVVHHIQIRSQIKKIFLETKKRWTFYPPRK